MAHKESESHRFDRTGWLRAAVLGANDGIVSTSSLILGVAAAHTPVHGILVTGAAALVAGATSMAAGEYVSVSSQADTEKADLEIEERELNDNPHYEREELAQIYVKRGLTLDLARQVSAQLTAHDALGAHARDELGITPDLRARPIQAAVYSAVAFSMGASLPLVLVAVAPAGDLRGIVAAGSWLALVVLGMIAARVGGANIVKGAIRVGLWGMLAMTATTLLGMAFGAA